MKLKMKHIFLALIIALMVAVTMIAAWAACPESGCNKGGYIEYDKMLAAQSIQPYYPVVFLMAVVGVAWLAKIGVERLLKK